MNFTPMPLFKFMVMLSNVLGISMATLWQYNLFLIPLIIVWVLGSYVFMVIHDGYACNIKDLPSLILVCILVYVMMYFITAVAVTAIAFSPIVSIGIVIYILANGG